MWIVSDLHKTVMSRHLDILLKQLVLEGLRSSSERVGSLCLSGRGFPLAALLLICVSVFLFAYQSWFCFVPVAASFEKKGLERGMDTEGASIGRLDDNSLVHILQCLDAAVDIAHASLVSPSWHRLVKEGRLWKRLCFSNYPVLADILDLDSTSSGRKARPSTIPFQENLEKEHRIFHYLYAEASGPIYKRSCIEKAVAASSTDNFPQESIHQTLFPGSGAPWNPQEGQGWSYWSSVGESKQDVPETLTYSLLSPLCVVHEIKVRPFRAAFQLGEPIYSAERVRFRLGFERTLSSERGEGWQPGTIRDSPRHYTWTYESPEYRMEQVDALQSFKLPRPILCVGRLLQVELLGRVQTQRADALYYICVSHVCVLGRPVSNVDFSFDREHRDDVLTYSRVPKSRALSYGTDTSDEEVEEVFGGLRHTHRRIWRL